MKQKKAMRKEKKAKKKAIKDKRRALKKAAKAKEAAKKAKEQQKKEEKAASDHQKRLFKEANRVKSRVVPLLVGMETALQDSISQQLPHSNVRAAQKFIKDLTMFEEEAKDILSRTRGEWSSSFEVMEEQLTSAKAELKLLEGLLAAFRKHHG